MAKFACAALACAAGKMLAEIPGVAATAAGEERGKVGHCLEKVDEFEAYVVEICRRILGRW